MGAWNLQFTLKIPVYKSNLDGTLELPGSLKNTAAWTPYPEVLIYWSGVQPE